MTVGDDGIIAMIFFKGLEMVKKERSPKAQVLESGLCSVSRFVGFAPA